MVWWFHDHGAERRSRDKQLTDKEGGPVISALEESLVAEPKIDDLRCLSYVTAFSLAQVQKALL